MELEPGRLPGKNVSMAGRIMAPRCPHGIPGTCAYLTSCGKRELVDVAGTLEMARLAWVSPEGAVSSGGSLRGGQSESQVAGELLHCWLRREEVAVSRGIRTASRGRQSLGGGAGEAQTPASFYLKLSLLRVSGAFSDVPTLSPSAGSRVPLTLLCPAETLDVPPAPPPAIQPTRHAGLYFSSPVSVLFLPFLQGPPECPCPSIAMFHNCSRESQRAHWDCLASI